MSQHFEVKIGLNQIIIGALFIALIVATWIYGPQIKSALSAQTGVRFVTVDVVKIVNAQRALISQNISGDNEQVVRTTVFAGRNAENVMRQVAGPNAVILVKQGVVTSTINVEDITDRVIEELGLDPNVKTSNILNPAYQLKGTDYANSDISDLLERDLNRKLNGYQKTLTETGQDKLIP